MCVPPCAHRVQMCGTHRCGGSVDGVEASVGPTNDRIGGRAPRGPTKWGPRAVGRADLARERVRSASCGRTTIDFGLQQTVANVKPSHSVPVGDEIGVKAKKNKNKKYKGEIRLATIGRGLGSLVVSRSCMSPQGTARGRLPLGLCRWSSPPTVETRCPSRLACKCPSPSSGGP